MKEKKKGELFVVFRNSIAIICVIVVGFVKEETFPFPLQFSNIPSFESNYKTFVGEVRHRR